MYAILICALLGLGHAATSGSNQANDAAIGVPGAFEVPVEWDVQAFPDGPVLTLVGTAQEVHAQLLKINPNHTSDFRLESRDSELGPRTDFSRSKVICSEGLFGKPSRWAIADGIAYLLKLRGHPRNQGGPGACGRVSCSYDSAIWWCNDSKQPKTLDGWFEIADGAAWIAGECFYGGQVFDAHDWNVIVRSASC
ncbi:Uncharacterized protein TCAP_01923 [Tolypocladium capitatum]|uniref:Secreted protein n=1 Tax=Tolypocladium capitatum TaxID=45235 RepID=A0A2K3QKW5_9HYPO|nr:Uncharacterized protein TCAP_01923 [Tolypocladium capitatum]